jgi:hypothetical protein
MGTASQEGYFNTKSSKPYNLTAGMVTFGTASITSQIYNCIKSAPVVTRTGTGTYSVSGLPLCTLGKLDFSVVSPAATILNMVILTQNFAAGTATFKTTNSVDPASGDQLIWSFTAY